MEGDDRGSVEKNGRIGEMGVLKQIFIYNYKFMNRSFPNLRAGTRKYHYKGIAGDGKNSQIRTVIQINH